MPFDEKRADKAVKFIESLKHHKGKFAGKPFLLDDWQKEIVRTVFGTVTPEGKRQFRRVYIEIDRKNGKTELAAAFCLVLEYADGEMGGEIYGAAEHKGQAELIYRAASNMINQQPTLRKNSLITDYRKTIYNKLNNSFYKVIANEAGGSHGFDASAVVFDEFHTQKDSEFHDVLATSMGSREEPLFIIITTAGYDRQSPCWKEHEYCINNFLDDDTTNDDFVNPYCYHTLPDSKLKDPTQYCYIRSADWERLEDPEDDYNWDSLEAWYDGNPALENPETGTGFRKLDDMKALALRAERDISFRNTFLRLYLGVWTGSASAWMKPERWKACNKHYDDKILDGRLCYGGLDLSSTIDLTAFLLLFPIDYDLFVKPFIFIPEETIRERSKTDGVPYQEWVDRGLVIATPGDWVDFNTIQETILRAKMRYRIHSIGYDRWEATQLVQNLTDKNLEMVPIGMGYGSMSSPSKELIKLVLAGHKTGNHFRLQHANHEVLNWCSGNMVFETDHAENIKPSKKKSSERIDPMVALIMAIDRWNRENSKKPSRYNTNAGLLEIG